MDRMSETGLSLCNVILKIAIDNGMEAAQVISAKRVETIAG